MLFCFWQTLNLQKSPSLPGAKSVLPHGYAQDMQIRRTAGLQCIRRRLLAISASKQYNEPPRLHRNFAKSHFVVQIYQTDARYGGSRNAIEEMTGDKRCLTVTISYPS